MKWPLSSEEVEQAMTPLRAAAHAAADERRAAFRRRAAEIKSDGCTGVLDWRVDCCYEHDVYYHDGRDLDGTPISRAEADRRFRLCNQARSPFGVWSPFAWWRWAGVRVGGHPWVQAVAAKLARKVRHVWRGGHEA